MLHMCMDDYVVMNLNKYIENELMKIFVFIKFR